MAILEELLIRLGVDMSEAEQEINQGSQEITGQLDGLATAGGVAAAGLGTAFAMGLESALDISSATTKLQQGLDLTQQEADRAGHLAGEVFSAGFSDSMAGAADAMGSVIGAMGKVGDFTDAELKGMTESAIALESVFGIDIPEAANAAGALIKQGLVADGTEAFDVLTKAAQTLPASMAADIPAIVTEYGTHFKRIGLDAQTAFGMMSQFVQAGGRDIDQAADVLHEFARITSEETDRAAEGFKGLKLDAGQMLSEIGKGGKPAADALQLTLEKLRGIKDPAERAKLQVMLFGDMAGEAADALLAMDPATAAASSGMDDAAGAAKRVTEGMAASPAQQWDSIMRTVSHTLGETLLPALNVVSGLLKENPGLVKVLVPVFLALAAALAVATVAQWAMNAALLANPYTWIVIAIIALAAIIIANWDKIKAWTIGAWNAVWEFIKTAADRIWNFFLNWTLYGLIIKHWDDIWQATVAAWNTVVAWVKQIPGWLYQAFLNWTLLGLIIKHWSAIKTATVTKAGEMLAWVRGLPGRVSAAIGSMGRLLYGKGRDVVTGLWNGISSLGGWLWGQIKSFVSRNVVDAATSFLKIGSPSKLMGDEVGRWLPPGIAEGAEDNRGILDKTMAGLVDVPALSSGGLMAPSTRKVRPVEPRVILDFEGSDNAFTRFFQEIVRTEGGGSVSQMAGANP